MSRKKIVGILLHILFTLTITVVVLVVMPMKNDKQVDMQNTSLLVFTALQVAGFYFTAYLLQPKLLNRKKVITFILSVCAICLLAALVAGIII